MDDKPPAPGDYDGDGITDLAYYTVYDGVSWIRRSSGGSYTVAWGQAQQTIVPTPGDYDGDSKTDVAYFYPSNGYRYIVPSKTGVGYSVWYGYARTPPCRPIRRRSEDRSGLLRSPESERWVRTALSRRPRRTGHSCRARRSTR